LLILNEVKAVSNVTERAGQTGAVNKSPVVSMAQDDDFQEIIETQKHSSKDAS
jgi:hypothetical protein